MDQVSDYVRPVFSVVVPIWNETSVIPELYRRVVQIMDSTGETWGDLRQRRQRRQLPRLLLELHEKDRACVLDFARNFGHQIAITAGRLRRGRRRDRDGRRSLGPARNYSRHDREMAKATRWSTPYAPSARAKPSSSCGPPASSTGSCSASPMSTSRSTPATSASWTAASYWRCAACARSTASCAV